MILQVTNPQKPHLAARHCVRCEGCRRNGPVVRHAPGFSGSEAAITAAQSAGWLLHHEMIRSPVRKWWNGRWSEQYFCKKCQKAGEVGKHPVHSGRTSRRAPAKG